MDVLKLMVLLYAQLKREPVLDSNTSKDDIIIILLEKALHQKQILIYY